MDYRMPPSGSSQRVAPDAPVVSRYSPPLANGGASYSRTPAHSWPGLHLTFGRWLNTKHKLFGVFFGRVHLSSLIRG